MPHEPKENVYVVSDLQVCLIKLHLSVRLKLVYRTDKSKMEDFYSNLCHGVGIVQQPCTIRLPFPTPCPDQDGSPSLYSAKLKRSSKTEDTGVLSRVAELID